MLAIAAGARDPDGAVLCQRLGGRPALQAGRAACILGPLNAAEAIEIARDWVARYAAGDPGFRAAHLMGGITRMAADDELPADSDLDLMLLVDRPTTSKDPIDELYRSVAIEAGLRGIDGYDAAEKILANPEAADHIAMGGIISDLTGLLTDLQPTVAREFSRRRWVTARCDEEKRRYEICLTAATATQVPVECMLQLMLAMHNLASLLSVALVVPPTHRKFFIQLREQVAAIGRPELAEAALAAFGSAGMTQTQVTMYAELAAEAFDRALVVKRTPAPFDFKLRPHLRPYTVEWSQRMLQRGEHREVMPWIAAGLAVSTIVLLNDAPEGERPGYAAQLQDMLHDLGYGTSAARSERLERATVLAKSMYAVADEVVASRPDELIPA
jgi:hypothetical protein